MFIISIINFEQLILQTSVRKKGYKEYIETLIELLRFRMKKVFYEVHNTIDIDFYLFKGSKTQRQLKSCQIV